MNLRVFTLLIVQAALVGYLAYKAGNAPTEASYWLFVFANGLLVAALRDE